MELRKKITIEDLDLEEIRLVHNTSGNHDLVETLADYLCDDAFHLTDSEWVELVSEISDKLNLSYRIEDSESGNFIDEFQTLKEAYEALKEYEDEDRSEGVFVENFYSIRDILKDEVIA